MADQRTAIVYDDTLDSRRDGRSLEQFSKDLDRGHALEAKIIAQIQADLVGVEGIKFVRVNAGRDQSPDLTISCNGKTIKVEIQAMFTPAYCGYRNDPELQKLGPVFHIRNDKMDTLKKFEDKSDNNRGFLCHVDSLNDKIYVIRSGKLRNAVYGAVKPWGGKSGHIVPIKDNLTDARVYDNFVAWATEWLAK